MEAIAVRRKVALAEAKNKLSALTAEANLSDTPFVIVKNNVPWVEVRPLAPQKRTKHGGVVIRPLRRELEIPDIDALFADYDNKFIPREDGLSAPAGKEAM